MSIPAKCPGVWLLTSLLQIFRMQTAPIRAELEDFEWVFVQGTVRHTEGNWSLHTSAFSSLPLYAYYNPLDPLSVNQTHRDLLQIIQDEGPFDGVLAYSGGAGLAAEMLIAQDPLALEPLFRFAVFINGASPLRVFKLADVDLAQGEAGTFDASPLINEAEDMFLRPSALRHKEGVSEEDLVDQAALLATVQKFKGKVLADGTPFLSDGEHGLCRWDRSDPNEPALIDVPTLHIRSPAEDVTDPHHGLHLLSLCDKSEVREIQHEFGHDFPRGRCLMKQIASEIRNVAEQSSRL
ncbi:uncharacterized protein MYCGRDRAFT_97426 [Zymoseptoria tritici IPO323]|uniref:Serine hydrolase domain-containing protein n=1 Tax=Zymoseptoria tritici (strain CBS 115943 / IPO323) TaxID=336722 RepID=F9XQ66_ZYMTI|nr:uncharacterized protein MYCGRDRAFT_97426 [Zymoseptoria tritici IPO323]EGP82584.1 hypothetical protein MYCGRDRAFT_97426 [Zymoseptoria tritici IPO323]